MAYEIQTIGDVAAQSADPPPLAAQAISITTTPTSTISDRVKQLGQDVVAQRTGLVVGLVVGAAAALLYARISGGKR